MKSWETRTRDKVRKRIIRLENQRSFRNEVIFNIVVLILILAITYVIFIIASY